jgi:hypothetical protein
VAEIETKPFIFKEVETVEDTVDRLLYFATAAWRELPEIAAEFEYWTPEEREDYLIEWPLEEMRLNDLKAHAEKGDMTPEQRRRYEALLEIVGRNRPIIERLLS